MNRPDSEVCHAPPVGQIYDERELDYWTSRFEIGVTELRLILERHNIDLKRIYDELAKYYRGGKLGSSGIIRLLLRDSAGINFRNPFNPDSTDS